MFQPIATIKQLVALFQVKYKMTRPFDIVQLVVLHHDVHHDDDTIAITSSTDKKRKRWFRRFEELIWSTYKL